jgi:hypothetical protein
MINTAGLSVRRISSNRAQKVSRPVLIRVRRAEGIGLPRVMPRVEASLIPRGVDLLEDTFSYIVFLYLKNGAKLIFRGP